MKIVLQTRLHFLISSSPLQATRQRYSPAHKRAKIRIYSHIVAVCFCFRMQSAVRWRNIPCWWCSTQGHARTHAASRDARAPGIILARRNATRPKMLWKAALASVGCLDPMFDSKGLVDPKMSANRVDEMELKWESPTISWRFGLSEILQSALKGKRPSVTLPTENKCYCPFKCHWSQQNRNKEKKSSIIIN